MRVKKKRGGNKTKGEAQNQKQRKHETPPHANHGRLHANGHEPRGNKGMTNKYVTTPCILHFPRYTCVGEETKYVLKEGAEGTTPHAKPNHHTRHKACAQTQTTPIYPHSSIPS